MAVFTVKVPEGELSKAIRQISAWDGKTRLRVEAALKRGTNAVYREARQRVPIRSGKLKKSIRQRFSTVKLEGQVFSNQPYAHLVEFGSRAHTVKPRKKKALRFFRGGPVFTKRARIPAQSGKPFLFNFREILQVMNLGPQELLRTLSLCSFVQIDKSGKDTFMKVFLPKGQPELRSRTHDFSRFPHVAMADLHKLDRAFSWSVHHVKARIHYGRIEGSLVFERSAFWKEPVYVSHAGQTQELTQGENWFSFAWSPTEDVYCGPEKGRYKGRALHLTPGC